MALKQRNRCLAGGSKQMFWACLSFLVQVWWSCFQRHNCYLNRWYLILTCFNIYFCFFNSFFHISKHTGSKQPTRCTKAPSWTVRRSNATESKFSYSDLHPTTPRPWNFVPFLDNLCKTTVETATLSARGQGSLPEGCLFVGCMEMAQTFTKQFRPGNGELCMFFQDSAIHNVEVSENVNSPRSPTL